MPPSLALRSFAETAPPEEWDEVTGLFVECFSAAPYFEDAAELRTIAEWGPAKLARGGRLVTAWQNGSLVGFALGIGLHADESWQRILSRLQDRQIAVDVLETTQDALVVQELAVRESTRGRGVARACVHELLRGRPENRVLLGVYESAEEATSMYGRWGFEDVGVVPLAGGRDLLHVFTATMARIRARLGASSTESPD